MVTVQIPFEELLKSIEQLPQEQKEIIRARLDVTLGNVTLSATGVVEDRLQAYRKKIYAKARGYWETVGDSARLALTDEELDEQFWLFDGDGIPRLKEDEGKVEVPSNSSLILAAIAQAAHIRTSRPLDAAQADEILNEEYADYLLKRMHGENDGAG